MLRHLDLSGVSLVVLQAIKRGLYQLALAVAVEIKDEPGTAAAFALRGLEDCDVNRLEYAERAYRRDPSVIAQYNRAVTLASLGDVYLATKNFEKALANWQRAIDCLVKCHWQLVSMGHAKKSRQLAAAIVGRVNDCFLDFASQEVIIEK